MGGGKFTSRDWDTFKTKNVTGKSTKQVYSRSSIKQEFDPKEIKIRESRDSDSNPESTAIIVALDVTGSMDPVLDSMARKGLPSLATEIYDRQPVKDPHIMIMGIGDAHCDRYPLQVTQFEADIRIAEQMKDIYLENGGGGNQSESYHLAWYFAAMKTSIDCFEKRGKKGYLFTVGDELTPPPLTKDQIHQVIGDSVESKITAEQLLILASRTYEVFHVIVEEGSQASSMLDRTRNNWRKLLGERVLSLSDHTKLSEVIVSTIQIIEGATKEEVIESWDGSTSMVVSNALSSIANSQQTAGGIVEL